MSSYLWEHPKIENEIKNVKAYMKNAVCDAPNIIKEPIEKLIDAGGKMLRPALVVLGAKFGDYKSDKIIPIASCIEMLHIATLIHDDIIDGAQTRRGIKSTNEEYSKEVAVLIGDYLFAKTFDILAGDYPTEILKNLSSGIMNICKGELIQHSYRFKQDLEIDEYLRLISGKTASLFSMSLFAGAYQAKANIKTREALAEAGYNLGVAFQIVDDCLDYNGNSDIIGKSVLSDLKDGYYTLPLLYALKNDNSGKLSKLALGKNISVQDFETIKKLVIENGGVEKSKTMALSYSDKAILALNSIKDNEYKEILKNLIEGLVFRSH